MSCHSFPYKVDQRGEINERQALSRTNYGLSFFPCFCNELNETANARGLQMGFQMGCESGIVARVTKRVLLQNLSNENNFDLHENDLEHGTHFY